MLAQSESLGLFQAILDGGVPLLLLTALVIVSKLYYNERRDKDHEIRQCLEHIANLRAQFTNKIEELFRERLELETQNLKVIMRTTEVLESVIQTLERTSDTLDRLSEE